MRGRSHLRLTVVHNPFAEVPLHTEIFAPFPNLSERTTGTWMTDTPPASRLKG